MIIFFSWRACSYSWHKLFLGNWQGVIKPCSIQELHWGMFLEKSQVLEQSAVPSVECSAICVSSSWQLQMCDLIRSQWCPQMCCLSHCLVSPVTALAGGVRVAATDPGVASSPSLGMPCLDVWIPFMLCPVPSWLCKPARQRMQRDKLPCVFYLVAKSYKYTDWFS